MLIATLIAADALESGDISEACDRLFEAGQSPSAVAWLATGKAADISLAGDVDTARSVLAPLAGRFDICVQSIAYRRKMLLVSDMDSTMIMVECIDELADYAGIKTEIADITARAMAGELDFTESLRARVALLAGLDEGVIVQCLRERVRLMPGAEILVQTMSKWGAHSILVSGGFTHFTGPVAQMIGLAEVHGNVLEIDSGKLTGRLIGPIVDAGKKRQLLLGSLVARNIASQEVLAVGDGANDAPMIESAVEGGGIGAAHHGKAALVEKANFSVRHNDLTALLYAQGISPSEWVSA